MEKEQLALRSVQRPKEKFKGKMPVAEALAYLQKRGYTPKQIRRIRECQQK